MKNGHSVVMQHLRNSIRSELDFNGVFFYKSGVKDFIAILNFSELSGGKTSNDRPD